MTNTRWGYQAAMNYHQMGVYRGTQSWLPHMYNTCQGAMYFCLPLYTSLYYYDLPKRSQFLLIICSKAGKLGVYVVTRMNLFSSLADASKG